jgi:cell division septum initiation protein DivIVA
MSMASQHLATTALLAAPALATGQVPAFTTVNTRGYHKGEVEQWAKSVLSEIERLGRQVASFAGHELTTPAGQKLMAEVLQIVADEAMGQKQAADQEIAQLLEGAREQARQIIEESRAQAQQTAGSATDQAAAMVSNARAESKRMTDEAAAHAAAVHEAAEARMALVARFHQDGLDRIRQVYEKTGQMLAAEEERGSLAEEVSRALALVRQQPSARAPR